MLGYIQTNTEDNAISYVRIPRITRYFNEAEYVDQFFDDGRLRISTFEHFRQNPQEEWADRDEGISYIETRPKDVPVLSVQRSQQQSFVLCGTLTEDKSMSASFKKEHGFRIIEPLQFYRCIAHNMPLFAGGVHGICNYAGGHIQKLEPPTLYPTGLNAIKDWAQFQQITDQAHAAYYFDSLFRKQVKYAAEQEYRLIWFTALRHLIDYIDIRCPEARRYCQRII